MNVKSRRMRRLNKAGLPQRLFAFFVLGFAWLVFIYYLILLIFKEGYFGGEALLGGGFLLLFIAVMTFLAYPTVGDWNVYEQGNSLLLKRYWKKVYLNKDILSIKSFGLITFLTGSFKLETNKGTYFIRHYFPPEGFFINPEAGKRDLYRVLEPYLASYDHDGMQEK